MAGTSVDQLIDLFLSKPNKTGQDVRVETVLGLSAVFRALNILSDSIASLPINVKQLQPDGDKTIATRHAVHILLNGEPHPAYTTYTLFHTLVSHAALYGNAYAVITRQRVTKYPTKISVIEPHRVEPVMMENDRLVYKIHDVSRTFHSTDVIHFGGLSWNGLAGVNVLEILRDNFGLALANQEYLAKFFADGATIAGVIKHPGRLTDDAMRRLRNSWESRYGGSANSGKTAILEEGMEYDAIGLSPQQAAAAETKKLTIADISRIFGVPQFLLEDLDRATFNNIEHLSLLFIKHTVRPWCKRIEAELNRKLFPRDEQGEYKVVFDLDDLLMSDLDNRSAYIDNMMKWGILNRDEVRQREGYNKIEDGSGEAYYVPMNMVDPTKPNENNNGNSQEPDPAAEGTEDVPGGNAGE